MKRKVNSNNIFERVAIPCLKNNVKKGKDDLKGNREYPMGESYAIIGMLSNV